MECAARHINASYRATTLKPGVLRLHATVAYLAARALAEVILPNVYEHNSLASLVIRCRPAARLRDVIQGIPCHTLQTCRTASPLTIVNAWTSPARASD